MKGVFFLLGIFSLCVIDTPVAVLYLRNLTSLFHYISVPRILGPNGGNKTKN